MVKKYINLQTPIDELFIVVEKNKVVAIYIGKEEFYHGENVPSLVLDEEDPLLIVAKQQFVEYFSRRLIKFDLPIQMFGTPFQLTVWKELLNIPYGKTKSYQEIAQAIGNEKAVRAVGQANKANKLPIVVPCHRVIGKNKRLTGYAGKRVSIKEQLLLLEGFEGFLT